eukprot:1138005-Pelagomonas_calceolata.AAC.5
MDFQAVDLILVLIHAHVFQSALRSIFQCIWPCMASQAVRLLSSILFTNKPIFPRTLPSKPRFMTLVDQSLWQGQPSRAHGYCFQPSSHLLTPCHHHPDS